MYIRSTGVQIGVKGVGPVPWSQIWNGVHRAFVSERYAFGRQGNVRFVGSAWPNIFFGVGNYAGAWAMSWHRGYGYGTIRYSNSRDTIALLKSPKYKDKWDAIYWNLAAHEGWHVMMSTNSQVGREIWKPAMVAAYQNVWGKPVRSKLALTVEPSVVEKNMEPWDAGEVHTFRHEDLDALL
jgi:hypothetical protein